MCVVSDAGRHEDRPQKHQSTKAPTHPLPVDEVVRHLGLVRVHEGLEPNHLRRAELGRDGHVPEVALAEDACVLYVCVCTCDWRSVPIQPPNRPSVKPSHRVEKKKDRPTDPCTYSTPHKRWQSAPEMSWPKTRGRRPSSAREVTRWRMSMSRKRKTRQ